MDLRANRRELACERVELLAGDDPDDQPLQLVSALGEHPAVLTGSAIAWFARKGTSTEVPLAKLLARARHAATSTTRNVNTVDKVLHLLG